MISKAVCKPWGWWQSESLRLANTPGSRPSDASNTPRRDVLAHEITWRYLVIDQVNRTYLYNGASYDLIPVALAVDRVSEGLEETGWTGATRYDEEFVA